MLGSRVKLCKHVATIVIYSKYCRLSFFRISNLNANDYALRIYVRRLPFNMNKKERNIFVKVGESKDIKN